MPAPKMVSTIPTARFNVFGSALFAKRAATLAQSRVLKIQKTNAAGSGVPPIIKWLAAPVKAVNVIINTLVPTAVFNS